MSSPRLPFEKKRYTRILPAPEQDERGRVGDGTSMQLGGGGLPPKRQKRAGRFACDACRSKKSACDGQKPTCSPCTRRGTTCVYSPRTDMTVEERAELEQLRQQRQAPRGAPGGREDDEDLLYRLKTLPEDAAVALLLQMRSEAQVRQDFVTVRNIPPPSRTSVEFELMHRHPIVYPVVAALDPLEIKVSHLGVLPYREHEAATTAASSQFSSQLPSSHRPSPASRGSQQHLSPESSGSSDRHPQLCDQRLEHIKILNWTQVPISNDLDLFLGDLVAHRTEFCCPFLLSAVLCFACQGYSSIDPDTADLSYAFFNEAQQLHREESTGNPQYQFAIPNIAATQLLSLAAACHGRNELALRYLIEGIELAHQNGLVAVDRKQSASNWLDDHVDYVKAASHTAWGTFCRATLLGMTYQNAYIRIPSWLPIPGTNIVRANGESEPFELPAYMGQSFTELCRLTPLINEMLREYHDSGDGIAPTKRASFSFAQGLYSRMLGWADDLPVSMARGIDMPHHAAVVHIYFHTAVLDLFRPFPYQRLQTPFRLGTFAAADDSTPEDIYDASVSQLKHLILIFRSKYTCAASTMLWQNALIYVANACLPLQRGDGAGNKPMEDIVMTATAIRDGEPAAGETNESEEDADREKWFAACIDALRALAPQFSIVTGIVQGILSMAILKGCISAAEGRAIMGQLKADTEASARHRRAHLFRSSAGPGGATQAAAGGGDDEEDEEGGGGGVLNAERESSVASSGNGFVIDLNEAAVNPSAASLDVLARAFDELAMFDEFTTVSSELNPDT